MASEVCSLAARAGARVAAKAESAISATKIFLVIPLNLRSTAFLRSLQSVVASFYPSLAAVLLILSALPGRHHQRIERHRAVGINDERIDLDVEQLRRRAHEPRKRRRASGDRAT